MATPRILVFPHPAPGHVKPFLSLAELPADAGLDVVFLSTEYNHRRISNLAALSSRFPTLRFDTISDGLPPDQPRDHFDDALYWSIRNGTKPRFRLLQSYNDDSCTNSRPITCIITDLIISAPIEVAEELRIPVISFCPYSARCLSIHFSIPKLVEEGQIPYEGMDIISYWMMKKNFGPLNALSKSRLGDPSFSSSSLGGFWKEDQTCMSWLDSQPPRSVIFVSFGSTVRMKADELAEFWHGLVNSDKPFLCVVRSGVVVGGAEEELMKQLVEEGGKEIKGIVVKWASQEKVLNHSAIGGFLMHCGWNSTLESIAAGVPMVCWPVFGDQPSNATCIDRVWKIGVEIKGKCDRSTVEKTIRTLMEDQKREIQRSIQELSKQANEQVSEGGISFRCIENLVEDIKKMKSKI